ncbi:ABC transporter ATP-binding protein [Stackebrandtia nassauensis]|uniref:Oligopeptide/dipeptide ABC transporter, ATPase subunit n=1 Tax=Stackebrandtia nassauensis (strain DSM 44728 / CIP 108903 / NRRL B-16338 / NBRC 102104 / LLR-40K-21) TaxID=446470 RepID=D3QB32_STANL|nr:ABC transporter ATP-binding protein [Stackebrandtia nassauensis]ADD40849.1 oligopeptide/dipeptide ABC transporter, ATPase subunit [Stackebrandtia nassauensis DSM 44728]
MNDEDTAKPLLSVRDLRIDYRTGAGRTVNAIRGVDFDLYPHQSLALVGESGCGKSTLALGLMRLLPKLGRIPSGSVTYRDPNGKTYDVLDLSTDRLRQWRWSEVAMVFQGAMNAFNPVLKIVDQFADTMKAHAPKGKKFSKNEIYDRAAATLESVRLEPKRVLPSYPHELSGGMRQRVLIALSLLLKPQVLVLDEPTTALDLLTQRAIVDMLHELRAELGFAMIFVSHDLPLASELADRVATMYAGRIIESGTTRDTFMTPRHPYTRGLIKAVPPVRAAALEPTSIPGSPPDLAALPTGCTFRARCEYAIDECETTDPGLELIAERDRGVNHEAACIRWQTVHLEPEEAKR